MSKPRWRPKGRPTESSSQSGGGYESEFTFDDRPFDSFASERSPEDAPQAWGSSEEFAVTAGHDVSGDPRGFHTFTDGFDDGSEIVPAVGKPPASPIWILGVTAVAGAVAILLATLSGHLVPVAFLAWAVGGPAAILVYGMFLTKDAEARGVPGYTYPEWLNSARYAALVVVGLGVLAASWRIGEWAGRL